MSSLQISKGTPNATSSRESADGASPPGSLVGLTHTHSGRAHHRVRMSASVLPCGASERVSAEIARHWFSSGFVSSTLFDQAWQLSRTCPASKGGYNLSRSERSTADIGGPHLRRRVWRLAYRDSKGQQKPRRSGTPAPFSDPRRTPPGDVWSPAPNRAVGMDDGFPARVAAIRAFGNAIDPWAAARILEDYLREAS
jgi:hypothetical protein